MEEPGGLQSMGLQRVGHDWATSLHFTENIAFTIYFVCYSFNIESPSQPYGEGKGNPLQCSCLEIPRDRGTWWAAICWVAQSRTRLKRLSSSSSNRHYWKVLRPCLQMFCLQFSHWAICQVFLSMLCSLFFLIAAKTTQHVGWRYVGEGSSAVTSALLWWGCWLWAGDGVGGSNHVGNPWTFSPLGCEPKIAQNLVY